MSERVELQAGSEGGPLVLIAAGGTGGHLFPAIAVAGAIRRAAAHVRVAFVGTGREVERRIIVNSGYPLIELRVKPLKGKSILYKLGSLAALIPAFVKSAQLIRRLRPALVIGGGGYVSGPFVLAAALSTPTLIMEVNLKPGLTTRWLAPFVDRVACSFVESVAAFGRKAVHVGHPARPEFFSLASTPHDPPAVLVMGGSQGSSILNRSVIEALPHLAGKVSLVHQTGQAELEKVRAAHAAAQSGAVVAAFIDDVAGAFATADLIVSRAGASTLAEIVAAGKPSLLIPFAAAADNHQEINARAVERAGAAVVITEKEISGERLAAAVLDLLAAPERRQAMSQAARSLANPHAAEAVASLAVDLMKEKLGV